MRLNKFESAAAEPLGEGDERKAFIDPNNEQRIISERKEEAEKDTLREMKGRYYLTKIAHLLLPNNIPDVHQAGETAQGKQLVDAERISHSQGHALLQERRRHGVDEGAAAKKIIKELGPEMRKLDLELERIGFGFNIDPNVGNYTKDEAGNVYYLEAFKPWRADAADEGEIEILFDEEALRDAIEGLVDPGVKEKCNNYLERLLALLEEEKREMRERPEKKLADSAPFVGEFEALIAPFMDEKILAGLQAIKTKEEASNSKERDSAKIALFSARTQLTILHEKTNITAEEYKKLYEKYSSLSRAVGMINSGRVDHER